MIMPVSFITRQHTATRRDYLDRVLKHDKAACAEKACAFGYDYWDGDRSTGYGGYTYDGRWRHLAQDLVTHFQVPPNARILDVGCGKGFLLYELSRILPDATLVGVDISGYALDHAKPEIKPFLQMAEAQNLPFPDHSFDLVIHINVIHNLFVPDQWRAIQELQRVGIGQNRYFVTESYRTEREKVNLMYWQLTCRAFHTPHEWCWLLEQNGYVGAYEFIFFE